MKRTAGAMALVAAMSGCVSTEPGAGGYMSQAFNNNNNPVANQDGIRSGAYRAAEMPGYQGPNGQPMAMTAAALSGPQSEAEAAARATLAKALPPELYQQVVYKSGQGSGIVPASNVCPPGGCPPGMPGMGLPPGMGMPGMGMPGMPGMPGMGMPGMGGPPSLGPPGAVAAVGALTGGAAAPFRIQRTEVRFVGPAGMRISWFVPGPDGKTAPSLQYLEAPGRYNFLQAAIYRLKLSDIPNRPGVELYPTLEVVPSGARAQAFLAHSAVPVSFTEEDLEQVGSGNYVVKVIYLPDPQFQDLASTGPDEVVSSRLEPGQDPIAEAHRRGSILLVVRLGNIDLEAPNTPAMDAPSPAQRAAQGMLPPGMVPPGMMGRPAQPMVAPKAIMPPGMVPGMMPPGMIPPGARGPAMPPAGGLPMIPMPPQVPAGSGQLPGEKILNMAPESGKSATGGQSSAAPMNPITKTSLTSPTDDIPVRKRSVFDLFRSKPTSAKE